MIKNPDIIEIISEQSGVPASQIVGDTKLVGDLNLSNIEIVDLITKITRDYHIQLPEDFQIASIESVADLNQLIEQHDSQF